MGNVHRAQGRKIVPAHCGIGRQRAAAAQQPENISVTTHLYIVVHFILPLVEQRASHMTAALLELMDLAVSRCTAFNLLRLATSK